MTTLLVFMVIWGACVLLFAADRYHQPGQDYYHDERMILIGIVGFSFLFSGVTVLGWRALS